MQELEQLIKIYHAAFIAFLVLAVVFFVTSVILFFKFNIRGIFDMKTGRGARKTIQKMKELNAQTGKLRQDIVSNTPVRLSSEERISAPPTEKRTDYFSGQQAQNGAAASVQPGTEDAWDGSQMTELLSYQGLDQTTLLHSYNETSDLPEEKAADDPQPEQETKLPGVFRIERSLMWVHTEEVL